MAQAIRARWEPMRSLAFGSISGTYAKLGTRLANPASQIIFMNLTDANIIISFNGTDDHLILPASGGGFADDYVANGYFQSGGDQIWVKDDGTAATDGSIYASVKYEL